MQILGLILRRIFHNGIKMLTLGMGRHSVGKVLAVQARGPEFDTQHTCNVGIEVDVYNPSVAMVRWEVEKKNPQMLTCVAVSNKKTLSRGRR